MNKFSEIDAKYMALIEKYSDLGPLLLRIGLTAPRFTVISLTLSSFTGFMNFVSVLAGVSILLGFYFRFGCALLIACSVLIPIAASIEFGSSFNMLNMALAVIPAVGLLLVGPGKYSLDTKPAAE